MSWQQFEQFLTIYLLNLIEFIQFIQLFWLCVSQNNLLRIWLLQEEL